MKKIILSTVACATMMLAANPDYKYEITTTIGGVHSEGNLGLDRDYANAGLSLGFNQFDSLISFSYNIGTKNFNWSTLLKKLNLSDYEGCSQEFGRWNQANGKILNGLVLRRQKEKELFLKV